jgi:hypothetical protein
MKMFLLGMLLMSAVDLLVVVLLRHRFHAALARLIELRG